MAAKVISTPYDAITYKVIGCAMAVHRELGPGLREDSYQRALANKMTDASITFEAQRLYEVFEGQDQPRLVGYYVPDFVIEGAIIVEIKALRGIDKSHLSQVIGYLAISACPLGLLINFGERSLAFRRVFPPKKVINDLANRQWLFIPDWLKQEHDRG
jgi:GxxExxY protein